MAEPAAHRILEHLRGRRDAMVDLLVELTEMESPTGEPESQGPVQRRLARELSRAGYRVRCVPGRDTGGHLWARPRTRSRGVPFQMLVGHSDTVWPPGTLSEMPVHREAGRLYGPGTFDMKAGLVQMVFALAALEELDLEVPVTPAVLVTSDEEVGSPESWRHIERLARRARRCFVLEPALGLEGRLKTARKGTGRFEVLITGRSSHTGLAPEEGASAIEELSHVVQRLHRLNDPEEGVSVNVGQVSGGIRANVVAPRASAVVDVRVPSREHGEEVERSIRSLAPVTPGTRLEIRGRMDRPPMERTSRNRELWGAAREAGRELGLELREAMAGGASDGNITSLHTATLDGLGAVGDGAHAPHEHVLVEAMPERSALLALLLTLPARKGRVAAARRGPDGRAEDPGRTA